jgi:hypothetical protein
MPTRKLLKIERLGTCQSVPEVSFSGQARGWQKREIIWVNVPAGCDMAHGTGIA